MNRKLLERLEQVEARMAARSWKDGPAFTMDLTGFRELTEAIRTGRKVKITYRDGTVERVRLGEGKE